MLQREFRARNPEMSGEAVSSCKLDTITGRTKMSKLQRLLMRQWFQVQTDMESSGCQWWHCIFQVFQHACKSWLNLTFHFLDLFSQAFEHLQRKSHGYADWCPQVQSFQALYMNCFIWSLQEPYEVSTVITSIVWAMMIRAFEWLLQHHIVELGFKLR